MELEQEIQKQYASCTKKEQLYLAYLYRNMPFSDIVNYPFETYLEEARWAIHLREENRYAKNLPEEIFFPYVLFHRVNEEEIEPCRTFFGRQLEEKLKGKSYTMKEAALLVNWWCANEATYRSTDDRTSSAMQVYRCGFGRCGEESVFVVNALRSAGIPARQVYVPKWSHCDDNHAWVEVWCDGQWHYLGACEPELQLDRGWFDHASSRAMMIHSRWFSHEGMPASEKCAGKEGMNWMCNQLFRYGNTTTLTVHVKEEEKSVEGAFVKLEVMNEAAFWPIATFVTDETGTIVVETGLGSLHIEVTKNGRYKEAIIDTRTNKEITCVLEKAMEQTGWTSFDMIAPEDMDREEQCTAEEEAKKIYEAQLKEASERVMKKQQNYIPMWKHTFLSDSPKERMEYMSVLSSKDRVDAKDEVLRSHFEEARHYLDRYSKEIFLSYIWNPRVENEVLTSWRKPILNYFQGEEKEVFQKHPEVIWEWIQHHITNRDCLERTSLYTTPANVLRSKVGNEASQRVLFVAIARTLGVPARVNPITKDVQYYRDGEFHNVIKKEYGYGKLILLGGDEQWKYRQNWTIAKRTEKGYETLLINSASFQEGHFELTLPEGEYRILTANRLPSGTIYGNRLDFKLKRGECKKETLVLRSIQMEELLHEHKIPNFTYRDLSQMEHTCLEETLEKGKVICFLDVGKEPTEHVLNEFIEMHLEWKPFAKDVLFLLRSTSDLQNETLKRTLKVLPDIAVGFYDPTKEIEMVARQMYVNPDCFPLMVVTSKRLVGCFATSGYAVGIVNVLYRIRKFVKK